MIHTHQINKTRVAIITSYIILVLIIISVIYIIAKNFLVADSVNQKKIQTHTTQLDIDVFNKVLKQIQNS